MAALHHAVSLVVGSRSQAVVFSQYYIHSASCLAGACLVCRRRLPNRLRPVTPRACRLAPMHIADCLTIRPDEVAVAVADRARCSSWALRARHSSSQTPRRCMACRPPAALTYMDLHSACPSAFLFRHASSLALVSATQPTPQFPRANRLTRKSFFFCSLSRFPGPQT